MHIIGREGVVCNVIAACLNFRPVFIDELLRESLPIIGYATSNLVRGYGNIHSLVAAL